MTLLWRFLCFKFNNNYLVFSLTLYSHLNIKKECGHTFSSFISLMSCFYQTLVHGKLQNYTFLQLILTFFFYLFFSIVRKKVQNDIWYPKYSSSILLFILKRKIL